MQDRFSLPVPRLSMITDYLTNGGRIEVAQKMAGHSNAKTTGLYDRRNDDISVGEVERIGIDMFGS
jgi:integrase/recombinase XerD